MNMATVSNTEESSTEEKMQGGELVLDMRPSDIGLLGVLEMNPRWEQYAISLGLTIEQTKYYLEQQQEALRGLLALKHWRDGRCGSSYPGTWKFLLDVIKDRLGPVVADELRDKITANKPWTITGQIGDVTGGESECISKLKEFYLRDNIIQDDLLEMSPGLQYIPLSYVKVEKEKKERNEATKPESVEYDDMLRTVARGSKCILLQGNPGSGKTTTLRKICRDFAEGRLPAEIRMVIRVVLGDVEKGSEMKDLLTTCIDGTHQDLIEDIGSYAEEVNGEGVLFLLDGFDELARDLQKKSLIVSILNGKAYPKSSCIITSRPSATAQLPPQAVQQMDRIETQGFTEKEMYQFILQWFRTRLDTGKKVIEIIIANSILCDMCRNPLIALIACTIASEEQMLPDRTTELIKSFMCLLGNYHLQKTGKDPSIEEWTDLEEQCSSFKQLADLAFHGFLKGQYTFKDRDTSLPHCPSKLNHMGLFVVTSQKKSGVVVKSYRFFHLVVQEFLSAYALSLKPSEDQTTFWRENLVKSPNIETEEKEEEALYVDRRFETLFQFYAGFTNLRDASMQQLLFDMVDTHRGIKLDSVSIATQLCCILYQSQNEEFTRQLLSRYKPSLRIDHVSLHLQEFEWCLKNVSFSSLSFDRFWQSKQSLELVKQVCVTNKERLEEFYCEGQGFFNGALFPLDILAVCSKLKVLVFNDDAVSSRAILKFLDKSTSLQTLSMDGVQLLDTDAETVTIGDISRGIKQLGNLLHVGLKDCCDELTRGVVEGLTNHECISELAIARGKKEDINISQHSFVEFLNKSTSLQALLLERVHFADMDVESVVGDISRGVEQLKNLSNVILQRCCDELTRGLVEGLWRRHNPQHQLSSSGGHQLCDLIMDTLSESDGSLSLRVGGKFTKDSLDVTVGPSFVEVSSNRNKCISQQSIVKFLNKFAPLQTLSLSGVQLSDMDVETVVGEISGGIEQLKNLSDVRLAWCCDELTRGVVEGLWRRHNPQHQLSFSQGGQFWDLVMDTLSESDGSLSLNIYSEDGEINLTMRSLVVQGRQSCVEGSKEDKHFTKQSLVKFLNKFTSLQCLSLGKVQLSDMDVETVVGDISRSVQQLKNLQSVTLVDCCDELTRGVVEGLWTRHNPQHQSQGEPDIITLAGGRLWDLVMDILSKFDDSSSLKVSTGDGIINWDTDPDRGSLFLNVSGRAKDIRISQQSLVKFVNKPTFLYSLSLQRVQLVDMDVETVVGDISRGIEQLKNLGDVTLEDCCDGIIRGVVVGLWRRHNPQHQLSFSGGCGLWDLVINTLSECDLSLQVSSGDESICYTKDLAHDFTCHLYFAVLGRNKKGICISQQSLVKFLNKSTFQFPLFLSLERVQLSDMDVETVVGEISRSVMQLKNLSDVRLESCCDELTRGVVEGLWRRYNLQHRVSSQSLQLWDLVMDTLSKIDDSLSLHVSSEYGTIGVIKDSPDWRGQWSSLNVSGKKKDIHISQQSLVNFLNKVTHLQGLSLERVQLSDMDVETVVSEIRGIKQLKALRYVTLEDCCGELNRGMIESTWHIERFKLACKNVICSEKVLKSLENIKIRNNLKYLTINLREVPPHYMASIVCGCFQSTTVKELNFKVDHVKVTMDGVDEELLKRLEFAVRDNSTMRDLDLNNPLWYSSSASPVPVSVAEAILKGAAHNKGLEVMRMHVPHELQELADAVKQENKKLDLNVWYCKLPEIEESARGTSNVDSEDDYETADEGSM